jgi:hypothetical protein
VANVAKVTYVTYVTWVTYVTHVAAVTNVTDVMSVLHLPLVMLAAMHRGQLHPSFVVTLMSLVHVAQVC